MVLSGPLTEKQLAQIHNLTLNCDNKYDMFEHLVCIGVNASHALIMSNSYSKQCASFTLLPLVSTIAPREYHWDSFSKMMFYNYNG